MKNSTACAIILLIIVAGINLPFITCAQVNSEVEVAGGDGGILLLTEAYRSGLMDLKLAENVRERTVSPELQSLTETLIAFHTEINAGIKSMAGNKSIILPDELSNTQQEDYTNFLKISGEKLDRDYIDLLITSHLKSVELYEKAAHSEDSAIASFFAAGVTKIKEHLELAVKLKDKMKYNDKELRRSNSN